MPDYGLGRLPAPDSRDSLHPMRLALAPVAEVVLPPYKYWYPGAVLDQGQTSSCVGHAWQGWLNCSPKRTSLPGVTPFDIYREAQLVDEWPGEAYDGTSVRAGAKVMEAHNKLGEYVWASDLDSLKRWLLLRGPVVFGTIWTSTMFTPDAFGYVHPIGPVEGGHAYLCYGYSSIRKAFRFQNSWGTGWSIRGRFWMREDEVAGLIAQDGECCAAIEV